MGRTMLPRSTEVAFANPGRLLGLGVDLGREGKFVYSTFLSAHGLTSE
jgi:hypothetical protein